MKKVRMNLIIILVVVLLFTACTAPGAGGTHAPSVAAPTTTLSLAATPSRTPTPTRAPTPTKTPLPSSDGPTLLLQTGFETYQIIDFDLGITYPFEPPGLDKRYSLATNLSPSGKQMIFPVSEDEVMIIDLVTGDVHTTYFLQSDASLFQTDLAAEAALQALPGLKYSSEAMLAAVKAAYAESILNIRWYQSDNFILSVLAGSETSTQLYLDDLQTGMRTQLEWMPGLVENYWIGSSGETILLKKGFVFEPGVWQDDRYYLVDVAARRAEPIPLPSGVDNPSLFWLGTQSIGFIHQAQLDGSENFSIIDLDTMESSLIVDGAFNNIWHYGDKLALFRHDPEARTSTIQLLTMEGQSLASQTLSETCFHTNVVGNWIIVNCETESLILDEKLQSQPFGDPIFLLSTAPDGRASVLVTRTEEVFLLDTNLGDRQILTLEGNPLEVRWLPDSSGFIYRTSSKLYWFDLENGESELLLESDLFADYTNLNAVWIDLE